MIALTTARDYTPPVSGSNGNQSVAVFLQQSGVTLMQARRTSAPGQKGAKKFLERYGEQLVSGPLTL